MTYGSKTKKWLETFTGEYQAGPSVSDKAKIKQEVWVPCRVCWSMFERLRFTARYCFECGKGFCEGEHGGFDAKSGKFFCVVHHPKTIDAMRVDETA